jgi:hypothetical protein
VRHWVFLDFSLIRTPTSVFLYHGSGTVHAVHAVDSQVCTPFFWRTPMGVHPFGGALSDMLLQQYVRAKESDACGNSSSNDESDKLALEVCSIMVI